MSRYDAAPTTMATTTGIRYTVLQLEGTFSFRNIRESTPISDTEISAMPLAMKL